MKERTAKLASPTRLGMQSLRNIWQRLSAALMLVMLTMTVQTAWATTTTVTYTIRFQEGDGTYYWLDGSDGTHYNLGIVNKPTSITATMGSDVTITFTCTDGDGLYIDDVSDLSSIFGFTDAFYNDLSVTVTSKSRYVTHFQIDGFAVVNHEGAGTSVETSNNRKSCTLGWQRYPSADIEGAQAGRFIVTYSDMLPASWSGSGTEADPWLITNKAQLIELRDSVNNGYAYNGKYFKQTQNITLNDTWTPIGSSENYSFRGTYDGNYQTISGVNINSTSNYQGLFGFVGKNAEPGTIQNLTLANSTITGKDDVGGIVGYLLYGTVSNCHVLSSVSILASSDNSHSHGGIVGRTYPNKKVSNATIENCTSAASVTDNGKSGCSDFGGIVGYNYYYSDTYFSKVMGCFYYGTAVSASSERGAIVGLNYKADGTGISNCYYNYPSTISGIGFNNSDIGTTRVYTVTCPTGLSVTGDATVTYGGTRYYVAGATVTVSAPSQKICVLEATTGSISNVNIADDRHSATFTMGSGDVTLALSYSGTTSDGLTWSLSGTNHTELTIGGNGAMKNYYRKTVNSLWRTDAPWGYDITSVTVGNGVTSIGDYAFCGCQSLASVTLGSGVTSIGYAAINHCDAMTEITLPAATTTIGTGAFANSTGLQRVNIGHDGAVTLADNGTFSGCNALQYIVFPSPAGALANTTGNWSGLTDKLRAQFGSQLFLATNEGGTAAYKIATEQDLRNLATAVNAGNYADGKTFRQTANITMSSTYFTPIGNSYYFSGTYDGGDRAIIGLRINSNQDDAGLFRNVYYGGKVKNLYLDSPNVNSSYNGQSVVVSAVVGYLSDASTIENCYVVNPTLTISTSGRKYYGVIAGTSNDNENRISNCYFYDSNTDHNYKAINTEYGTITNVGRAYTIAATSPVTASATKAFTYASTDYYTGTVTLSGGTPHTNGGWVDTYTVDGTAIEGNTFSLTADATVGYSSTPDATHFAETADNEYTIYDATGWGLFCDLLAENDQGYFTGKTVVLDKDIAVTRMAGSTNHEFSGTFDGQKHTLTVAITGTVQGTAPFCEIKGATIRNLAVTGSVAGKRHSAGLVGFARGDNSVTNTIENCLVNTSVSITGDTNGYLGGIVGHGLTSALTIRGCAFTGSLTSTSNYTGGLQGWSDGNILTLQDDLFAPTSVSAANAGFHPVAFHNNNSTTTATVSNVYYTVAPTCTQASRIATANAAEQPKQQRNITAGENVTVSNIALTGDATEYTVSGITAYSGGGLQRGETLYYGSGDQLSLTLSNTAPDGYSFNGYTVSAGTLEGSTLTMPDEDVTVTAGLSVIDWATQSTGEDADHAYMIYNKDQLLLLAYRVNGTHGETRQTDGFSGKYFKLGADIDFTSADMAFDGGHSNYEAIGGYYNNTDCFFCGEFDGNNKTVKGIRINKNGDGYDSYADDNQGLFGMTQVASIHDVRLTDARITGINIVGGIVGNKAYGTVSNCTVTESDITASANNCYGIIFGFGNLDALTNNYYHGCTVNGQAVTSGAGCNRADVTANNGAVPARRVNFADDVSATPAIGTDGANGFLFDADGNGTPENYYRDGIELTLSYSGDVPAGYVFNGFTVYDETISSEPFTFTVTADAQVGVAFAQPPVSYIDADGKTQQCTNYTVLTGNPNGGANLSAGWYVVNSNITYTGTVNLNGDVHLILADGCTMNVTSSDGNGIDVNNGSSLTIYGQTDGTGTLNATGFFGGIITGSGNITISGGTVTATSDNGDGISTISGTITISGGTVTATCENGFGIFTHSGTITLGWTNPTDYIYATNYRGTVNIAGGQTLYDEDGNSYSGTLSFENIPNGKTLRPYDCRLALSDDADNSNAIAAANGKVYNVTLSGRTLYKDGAWNTLCLPFDVELEGSPLDGATAKTVIGATTNGNDLTINFGNPDSETEPVTVLKAGVPYIIKWDATNTNIVEPVFNGVTVVSSSEADRTVTVANGAVKLVGYYDALLLDPENGSDDFAASIVPSIYYMTADNTLKHTGKARTLRACRAYFQFDETDPNVGQSRVIRLNFGGDETTEILSTTNFTNYTNEAGAWYTVDGVKLDKQPTRKGLYIHNGRKVVIK